MINMKITFELPDWLVKCACWIGIAAWSLILGICLGEVFCWIYDKIVYG